MHVLRWYACWYYAYTLGNTDLLILIVYFIIVFRPFRILYKLSGIIMTITLLVGYALCFTNIDLISKSGCSGTSYYNISKANTLIFLVCSTYTILFAHIIVWLPFFKKCCRRSEQI